MLRQMAHWKSSKMAVEVEGDDDNDDDDWDSRISFERISALVWRAANMVEVKK